VVWCCSKATKRLEVAGFSFSLLLPLLLLLLALLLLLVRLLLCCRAQAGGILLISTGTAHGMEEWFPPALLELCTQERNLVHCFGNQATSTITAPV
jgi:hypothetical protein